MTSAFAATLFGPEDLRYVAYDPGPLGSGMVRVAFGAAGICGSDMHYFRHARSGDFRMTAPLILGHEIAGTVVEINAQTSLKPGQRVAVNPSRWCGTCPACRAGRENHCEAIYFMGSASKTPHMQGGFATIFDAIPAQCVPIPDHVGFRAAALAEPLAVCLHAVKRGGDLAGRSVLVVGAGPIGLLTLLAAKAAGAKCLAVADLAAAPLALAAKLGADETLDLSADPEALKRKGAAYDVVFEASGSPQGLASAIGAARKAGIVVQIGNQPAGDIPFPANQVMAKEIDLRGTFRFGMEFLDAVRLIAEGQVPVEALITAELPLSEAPAGLRLALDRSRQVKVILTAKT
jgi:L-idonate 5-dehydrogenase